MYNVCYDKVNFFVACKVTFEIEVLGRETRSSDALATSPVKPRQATHGSCVGLSTVHRQISTVGVQD
jgi:hypothetical protein